MQKAKFFDIIVSMENSTVKLNFNVLPHFLTAGIRQFLPGERHISRMVENRSILIILRKGILRFSENGVKSEVRPGEYYIQRPHNFQDGPVPSDSPNYFYISFTGAAYGTDGTLPIRGNYDPARINPLIDAISGLSLTASALEYESLLYSLLTELYKSQHTDTAAQKIHSFLISHYTEPVTIADIENTVYLSKNQIINLFREAYGLPPHKYLTEYRMVKAGDLIAFTDLPFTRICSMVGIEDYSVFYRAFLNKFKMSPKEYRDSFIADVPPIQSFPRP